MQNGIHTATPATGGQAALLGTTAAYVCVHNTLCVTVFVLRFGVLYCRVD